MKGRFDVVFSVNVGGLPGLGSTIASLVKHCSEPSRLVIHIMCSNMPEKHWQNLRALFADLKFTGEYHIVPYDADKEFSGLPALHGDLTAYGRLLIPDFIDAPKVLYLDSDLVVTCDVLKLGEVDMGGHVIGAWTGTTIEFTLDRQYFFDRGYSKDMAYFNSGVLLIDLEEWRKQKITSLWREIIKDGPSALTSHDQTILNRVCAGRFKVLPRMYNLAFLAHQTHPGLDKAIFHFIGSPKPWDILGRFIHSGYTLWKRNSPPLWEKEYQVVTVNRLDRAWNIRRSMLRSLKLRYLRRPSGIPHE